MTFNDPRFRHGPRVRVVNLPGGWFGKLLALCLAVVIGVVAVSFSLAILLIVFVVGAAIWGYFIIRRAVVGTPARSGRMAPDEGAVRPEESSSGRVIEGEVVGRDRTDSSGDQRD